MKHKNYPKFNVDGTVLHCIGWGADPFHHGWGWFATDIVRDTGKDIIYYGAIVKDKVTYGTFSRNSLMEGNISFYTEPEEVEVALFPIGWERIQDEEV